MSALAIIRDAEDEGLHLSISLSGRLAYEGPPEAFARMKPALVAHRDDIVAALARQSVERLYAEMAERAEASREWWRKPLADSPSYLEIENIVTGKKTRIALAGASRRRRDSVKQAPVPRDDDTPI